MLASIPDSDTVKIERVLQGGEDAARDVVTGLRTAVGDEEPELVATQAGHGVTGP